MGEERFLVVRLGSLGDIVHTLPAVHALRGKFPGAGIDWLVEKKWRALLAGNPDVTDVILLDRTTWSGGLARIREMRRRKYDCAIDFQGLYKSAALARLCGAHRRIGFARELLRERGARWFYTERVRPARGHVVDQNLAIVQSLGAEKKEARFPLSMEDEAERAVRVQLEAQSMKKYFVLSYGRGCKAK